MSHGRMGMIYDGEDKGLPIDDIILQVNNGLPSHIPVVSHNNYIDSFPMSLNLVVQRVVFSLFDTTITL